MNANTCGMHSYLDPLHQYVATRRPGLQDLALNIYVEILPVLCKIPDAQSSFIVGMVYSVL